MHPFRNMKVWPLNKVKVLQKFDLQEGNKKYRFKKKIFLDHIHPWIWPWPENEKKDFEKLIGLIVFVLMQKRKCGNN